MLFRTKESGVTTGWWRKFALLPTDFGAEGRIWLEWYEEHSYKLSPENAREKMATSGGAIIVRRRRCAVREKEVRAIRFRSSECM